MPFLRVIRDKRGYETTYLMHWIREGTRQRSRILYVFRSPGGVRVGREALEPEMLKQIEAQYPEIEFDWHAMFHNQQVIESAAEPRRPRKRPPSESGSEAPAPPQAPPPRFTVPGAIEGATPDEQIAFLAKWYETIREKIPQRAADPARQQVLLALCERLNPATWTDADQITAGLQQAGEALQRLSHVFAKRRRRSKKRTGAKPETHAAHTSAEESPESEQAASEPSAPDASEPELPEPSDPTPEA